MNKHRKFLAIILLFSMIFSAFACCGAAAAESGESAAEIAVREFNKRGNVILETTFEAMNAMNIEPADIVTVIIAGTAFDMPAGTSYSDVDSGAMIFRFDTEDGKVMLGINGGSFAEETNMAVKETIDEDPGYRWNVITDTVTVMLKEKGGYRDEYMIRNLERTNERADYSSLSDAEYANCRAVSASGVKADTLFRGSTPLNPALGRDPFAMEYLQEQGIKSVLNLADTVDEMTAFEAYPGSYYSTCSIMNPEMAYDFGSEVFAGKVKDCVQFILENDAPYYIHCKEGKDRSGILCAVLACALGATYEEIAADYMKSFTNFYDVEEGTETYDTILRTNLTKTLCGLFGVSDLSQADLKAEAEEYLLSCGLTAGELASLAEKIGA